MADPIARLRRLCLTLPGTSERSSHGEACFFVGTTAKNARMFIMVDDHHHGAGHLACWCAAPPGVQSELLAEDPDRFFRPPYVGHRGWIGVRIGSGDHAGDHARHGAHDDADWDELAEIVREAHRTIAPASLREPQDSGPA